MGIKKLIKICKRFVIFCTLTKEKTQFHTKLCLVLRVQPRKPFRFCNPHYMSTKTCQQSFSSSPFRLLRTCYFSERVIKKMFAENLMLLDFGFLLFPPSSVKTGFFLFYFLFLPDIPFLNIDLRAFLLRFSPFSHRKAINNITLTD